MKYKIDFCGKTDRGKVREHNEDNYIIDPEINFFAVADGMGGHNNGEMASKLAVELSHKKFKELFLASKKPEIINNDYSIVTNQLLAAFDFANIEIFKQSQQNEECKGMGTTLTAAVFNDSKISIVHIGDSRAYLYRKQQIIQLTEDHSYVMDQYKKGIITKEEMENSPFRNVLMKALGIHNITDYFILEEKFREGDIIILASDGLTKMIKDKEFAEIIEKTQDNISIICSNLITTANKHGGEDNITVVIAKVAKENFIDKIKKIVK
ncbi:MAG: Stp1/IreP family PP2C-type Ser/Thr phosphatase [Elusimicrobiota bacterium]